MLRRSAPLFAVEAAGFQFISKLIDGTFPNYQCLIPPPSDRAVTVECAPLLQALKRAAGRK